MSYEHESAESIVEMIFYNSYVSGLSFYEDLYNKRGFITYLLADLINHPEEYDVKYILTKTSKDELIVAAARFIESQNVKEILHDSLESTINTAVGNGLLENNPAYLSKLIDQIIERLRVDINGSIIESQSRLRIKNDYINNFKGAEEQRIEIQKSIEREQKILEILSAYSPLNLEKTTPPLSGPISEPSSSPTKRQRAPELSEPGSKRKKQKL